MKDTLSIGRITSAWTPPTDKNPDGGGCGPPARSHQEGNKPFFNVGMTRGIVAEKALDEYFKTGDTWDIPSQWLEVVPDGWADIELQTRVTHHIKGVPLILGFTDYIWKEKLVVFDLKTGPLRAMYEFQLELYRELLEFEVADIWHAEYALEGDLVSVSPSFRFKSRKDAELAIMQAWDRITTSHLPEKPVPQCELCPLKPKCKLWTGAHPVVDLLMEKKQQIETLTGDVEEMMEQIKTLEKGKVYHSYNGRVSISESGAIRIYVDKGEKE